MNILITLALLALAGIAVVAWGIRARHMNYWLAAYLRRRRPRAVPDTIVYVAVADHYEPYGGGASREVAHRRLNRWVENYPKIAAPHHDSVGRHPCHTYFYPIE